MRAEDHVVNDGLHGEFFIMPSMHQATPPPLVILTEGEDPRAKRIHRRWSVQGVCPSRRLA